MKNERPVRSEVVRIMLPWRRCSSCASVGLCGFGASRSIMATTYGPGNLLRHDGQPGHLTPMYGTWSVTAC